MSYSEIAPPLTRLRFTAKDLKDKAIVIPPAIDSSESVLTLCNDLEAAPQENPFKTRVTAKQLLDERAPIVSNTDTTAPIADKPKIKLTARQLLGLDILADQATVKLEPTPHNNTPSPDLIHEISSTKALSPPSQSPKPTRCLRMKMLNDLDNCSDVCDVGDEGLDQTDLLLDLYNDTSDSVDPRQFLKCPFSRSSLPPKPNTSKHRVQFEEEKLNTPPQTRTASHLNIASTSVAAAVAPARISALLSEWIREYNVNQFVKTYKSLGSTLYAKVVLDGLFEDAMHGGGVRVAHTAKMLPKLVQTGCFTLREVKASLTSLAATLWRFSSQVPGCYKYFGILFGGMMVQDKQMFSISCLHDMLQDLMDYEYGSEPFHAPAILAQTLVTFSLMTNEAALKTLWAKNEFDIMLFWPSALCRFELDDWFDQNGLEILIA